MKTPSDPTNKAVRHHLIRVFLEATALGDAIGATTEFQSVAESVKRTVALRAQGFPFVPVGGGWLRLRAGSHTDDTDMAIALARAFVTSGERFDAAATLDAWRAWLATRPPDVGMLTRQALAGRDPADPYAVSRGLFLRDTNRAPNGALMRNAVVCVMAPDLSTAFAWSLKQGILTHFHPLSVLCCAVQVWLIFQMFDERWPFNPERDWLKDWHREWTSWLTGCDDLDVKRWLKVVDADPLDQAMDTLLNAEFDADVFNPFSDVTTQAQGYVLLSLQVAVWAMQWARRPLDAFEAANTELLTPVADVFDKRGYDVLGWIALIGRDADTYGAIAGAMIACAMGERFPVRYTEQLTIHGELNFLKR